MQERLFWYDLYMRKLVMTQFKYIHEMCVRVGGRTLRHNQIFRMDSLPNFVTHGAPLRALRAR